MAPDAAQDRRGAGDPNDVGPGATRSHHVRHDDSVVDAFAARHAAAGTSSATGSGAALAVVSTGYRRVVLGVEDVATFGRADHVTLAIGHDPVDELVPDVAGAFVARDDRVVISNRSPRLALDIAAPGRPLLSLAPHEWYAPAGREFTVLVQGTVRHEMRVTSVDGGLRAAASGDETIPTIGSDDGDSSEHRTMIRFLADGAREDGPTIARASRPGMLVLTERQRAVLDAYVAPMAEGLPPATHQQVAEAIGVCRQTIRLECSSIWDAFFAAGVPMRDRRDTRDAITDAWARHRL